MEDQIISSVISKCTKSTISATLNRWGRMTDSEIDLILHRGSNTKSEIAKKIAELSEEKSLDLNIIGDLELTYIQLHHFHKSWRVFRLDGSNNDNLNLDPRSLRSRLVKAVTRTWNDGQVFGNMNIFAGTVWFRLHLSSSSNQRQKNKANPQVYNPNNSVFMVTFQNSPYVIISKTGIQIAKIISEAVKCVYGAGGVKDIQLSGRHVLSLADIVHKKSNEAISSTYRDKEMIENPLRAGQKRKEIDVSEEVDGIVDENRTFKIRRQNNVHESFGSAAQPVLEKVEYKFNVKFDGLQCQSSVEIKGKNTLKGLCQLSQLGYIKHPLPTHLTAITNKGRNSFTLGDKRSTDTD